MVKYLKKIWDNIGGWILVSPFIIVPAFLIILGIVGTISELSKPIESEVSELYIEGYNEGYCDGGEQAQNRIAYYVEEGYSQIHDFELDNAISTLFIYADGIYEDEVGKRISEAELQDAVRILLESQAEIEELIYDIDEIDIN